MPWKNGGGTTAEIARHPTAESGADFDWRLSAATVDKDGPFSLFEACDRTLIVLEGNGITLRGHEFGAVDLLKGSAPFSFAGDRKVDAELINGSIIDLNIMSRRSRHTHTVRRVAVATSAKIVVNRGLAAFFCESVPIKISQAGNFCELKNGDLVISEPGPDITVTCDLPCTILLIRIAPQD